LERFKVGLLETLIVFLSAIVRYRALQFRGKHIEIANDAYDKGREDRTRNSRWC